MSFITLYIFSFIIFWIFISLFDKIENYKYYRRINSIIKPLCFSYQGKDFNIKVEQNQLKTKIDNYCHMYYLVFYINEIPLIEVRVLEKDMSKVRYVNFNDDYSRKEIDKLLKAALKAQNDYYNSRVKESTKDKKSFFN